MPAAQTPMAAWLDVSIASSYYRDVGTIPVLSREKEAELARLVRQGDPIARDRLIQHNLRYVMHVAARFRGMGLAYLDLVQEGNIGLMTAVERFDPNVGVKFITYATPWIRKQMIMALNNNADVVIPPTTRRAHAKGQWNNGTPVREQTALAVHEARTTSLSQLVMERSFREPHVIPDQTIAARQATDLVQSVLKQMPVTCAAVLVLRYGLGPFEEETLKQISRRIGVSRERVRQIEALGLAWARWLLRLGPPPAGTADGRSLQQAKLVLRRFTLDVAS